jgi:hypothetical protein
MGSKLKTFFQEPWVWPVARLLVGGLYLITAIAKIYDFNAFIDEVYGYGLLPIGLAHLVGWVLPWVELFLACSLLLGVYERLMSAFILVMSVIFEFAGAYAIFNDSGIVCGCFGSLITLTHQQSLTIDLIMVLVAGMLALDTGKDFLTLSHLFDILKPEWRTKRPVWFIGAQFIGVFVAMAVVTGIVFEMKIMVARSVAKLGNLYIPSPPRGAA